MARGRRGLTIIELVTAVAIVAILATIAIPSMGWMIGRARASEAVDSLSTISSLEHAYHVEMHTYGNVVQIGFVPDGSNRYAYCVGPRVRSSCVQSNTDTFDFIAASGFMTTYKLDADATPHPTPTPEPLGNPHVSPDGFEADAYGRVSNQPAPNDLDAWLIDQDQSMVHYRVGY